MKQRLIFLSVSALAVAALINLTLRVPSPALAGGATQISGIGFFTVPGECNDPQGSGSNFATKLTGDLEGCVYTWVESAVCSPSGVYRENGHELFVRGGGGNDTFGTIYQDCPNLVQEIVGRCQHPIVEGSGTGAFEGVSGRLDFKDDIEAGNFPYRGHLQWP
jgi:hypothetical protein